MAHRITVVRGDLLELDTTIENVSDPANGKCFFTVKRNAADADSLAVFRKTSDEGEGVEFTPASGDDPATFHVKLEHAEQRIEITDDDLEVPMWFDFRFRTADGAPYTLRKGQIVFTRDITQDPMI